MAVDRTADIRRQIAALEERIDRQIFPSATDLEELRALRASLPPIRQGVEIVIDAWLIDIETREYADISVFFYTNMPVTVGEVLGWFESFGYRLQRKAEGLDRVQVSGMQRNLPRDVRIYGDWQGHLDVIFQSLSFRAPSTTGHHRRLTDEERRMRAIERGTQHRNTQERLDLEFSE
jgi:hypothetical protein